MISAKEQFTTSTDIQQVAKMIAAICPYRDQFRTMYNDFKLTLAENETGWFFECMLCKGAKCTGFLRNDDY
ncbi:MAG: hypothetical protein ACOY90_13755 [Candidatus Zhuqueibacterota bacterium]